VRRNTETTWYEGSKNNGNDREAAQASILTGLSGHTSKCNGREVTSKCNGREATQASVMAER
jgi:hypothetical protein